MSKYDETLLAITDKVSASNAARGRIVCSVSNSDLNELAHAMLNSPEHVSRRYDTRGQTPEYTEARPVQRYRESMKPMLKTLGLDKHDIEAMDTVVISKEHAAAMMDVSTTVVHDYLKAGRKLSMPVMAEDEAKMEINMTLAPERESVNRFSGDGAVTVTKERKIAKASNKVPAWLKSKRAGE